MTVLSGSLLRDLADIALESDEPAARTRKNVSLPVDDVEVAHHASNLKDKVMEAAEHGYLSCEYLMEGCPVELLYATASSFKMSTHQILVIVHEGKSKIVCDWRPSQEC